MENKKVRINPIQYAKLEKLSKDMEYPITILVQNALDRYLVGAYGSKIEIAPRRGSKTRNT